MIYFSSFTVLCCPAFSYQQALNQNTGAISKTYQEKKLRRMKAWRALIKNNQSMTTNQKLKQVNDFFNLFEFRSDINYTGQEDYWMTPTEFVLNGGGDCEDFSIAKYFTLVSLGVPEDKLRLMYVKALKLNKAHMVLLYYDYPGAEPLVLDNLISKIKPGRERGDLLPVYSFNGNSLWLNKSNDQTEYIGTSKRLSKWQDILKRIKENKE